MAEQLAGFSPETRRKYQACLRKIGYPSREEADSARARRQAVTDEVLRTYECPGCAMWHLTSTPMTDAQVRALEDVFLAEIRRLGETWQRLQQAARPYVRGHVIRRKTPADIDAAFAEQLDLLDQLFAAWFGAHQRNYALKLSHAETAEEARTLDVRARQVLEKNLGIHEADKQAATALHRRHREAAGEAMNQVFTLPSFGWRQHLAR